MNWKNIVIEQANADSLKGNGSVSQRAVCVEAYAEARRPPAEIPVNYDIFNEIKKHLQNNDLVRAIKTFRTHFPFGLKASKEIVEKMKADLEM